MKIRTYNPDTDYSHLRSMLLDKATYGGVIDEDRDSEEKLKRLALTKPNCLLVAEKDEKLVGTVTVFEDGRACWLYRFAYQDKKIGRALWGHARMVAKELGHTQVLVYAPYDDSSFKELYNELGFNTGNPYTAYWQNID